jgi:serine protease Do
MNRSRKLWMTMLAVAVVMGLRLLLPGLGVKGVRAASVATVHSTTPSLRAAEELSVAFANVADTIKPSVVNVSSVKEIKAPQQMQQMPRFFFDSPSGDRPGEEFFRRFFQRQDPGEGYVQHGLGTGVIVSDDGYVLTNNHVVANADKVTVRLSDDRTFTAKVVGTDAKTDIAVLKIDSSGLSPATLGNSDELRVGEWVVAAGNPFGLTATITAGIVSAKGRAHVGIADYEDFIQTDAAINPGNSGGPLVNLQGEVIGINTAIASKNGGNMGVGFAIPINMAKSIMHSLIDNGKVVRGWLGAGIQNLNEGLAKSFGYEGTEGVLVGDVMSDGPGAKAGLQAGDIIMQFNSEKTLNMDKLRAQVASTAPGTTVRVEVFRDGKSKRLNVKIGELDSQAVAANNPSSEFDLGMTVQTLTPDIATQLGYDNDLDGVVVTSVDPLGVAARASIRVKDVIVSIQGQKVENVGDFRSLLKKYDPKDGVRLGVRSGSMQRFVFIQESD